MTEHVLVGLVLAIMNIPFLSGGGCFSFPAAKVGVALANVGVCVGQKKCSACGSKAHS